MKYPKSLIFFLLISVILGCQQPSSATSSNSNPSESDQGPFSMATSRQINELLESYLNHPLEANGFCRLPSELRPEVALPRLHSWFTLGRGMETPTPLSTRGSGFKLKKIPKNVLADLQRITLDSSQNRISFAVLTQEFWREIERLQDQGFNLAVLECSEQPTFSGLYVNANHLIAFDILSEPGTLVHEKRHSQQIQRIASSSNMAPAVLSEKCLTKVSRAFGEVDATLFELPLYHGISSEITDSAPVTVKFPQVKLFSVSMTYPMEEVGHYDVTADCPDELKEAFVKIYEALAETHNDLEFTLMAVRDHRLRNPKEAQKFRVAFEKLLADEIVNRPKKLNAILSKLSPAVKKDLCSHTMGFAFLTSCDGDTGNQQ